MLQLKLRIHIDFYQIISKFVYLINYIKMKNTNKMIKKSIRIFLMLVLVLGVISCASDESKIKESVEASYKKRMNDPESFEYVNFEVYDTIRYVSLDYIRKIDNDEGSKAFREFTRDIDEKNHEFHKVFMYGVKAEIRENNSFGGKVRNKFVIHLLNDDNLTVLRIQTHEKAFEEALEDYFEIRRENR